MEYCGVFTAMEWWVGKGKGGTGDNKDGTGYSIREKIEVCFSDLLSCQNTFKTSFMFGS